MKTRQTIKLAIAGSVLAGLLGFSSLGMAQSNAIEALNSHQGRSQPSEQVERHARADSLATALDQYNEQDSANRGLATRMPTNARPQVASHTARQLSQQIDAYNASATAGRVPSTHMPAGEIQHSATPMAERLASEVTAYNRTGGHSPF